MKLFISTAALCLVSFALAGCEASIGPNNSPPPGTTVHEKTVYDANGNVVSQQKSTDSNTPPNQ